MVLLPACRTVSGAYGLLGPRLLVAASMRGPPRVNIFLSRPCPQWSSPTSGRRLRALPGLSFLGKVFVFPRRFALLPFALLVERLAPVPVGVLNLKSGAAISAPN